MYTESNQFWMLRERERGKEEDLSAVNKISQLQKRVNGNNKTSQDLIILVSPSFKIVILIRFT